MAVTVTRAEPGLLGTPVITQIGESMAKPAGSPVADQRYGVATARDRSATQIRGEQRNAGKKKQRTATERSNNTSIERPPDRVRVSGQTGGQ
jgi:hypothetical protein